MPDTEITRTEQHDGCSAIAWHPAGAHDPDDLTGTSVRHYSIVALIAAGGQGRVYRGRDARARRDVAVKVVAPLRAADAAARHRLAAEARALARLHHPRIARLYDFITEDDRDFIVMEFVAGASLHDVLAGGPLPANEVLRLGSQLARGLAAAHAAGVVHCDIKPSNLKLASSGGLKILDFGVATLLAPGADGGGPTRRTAPAGTMPYMAPEQVRGEVDARSDIFSAGAVLYEMATGSRAFAHGDLIAAVDAVQYAQAARPSVVNPHVPLALERVIAKSMRKEPAARYQSAGELAAALDVLAKSLPVSSPPTLDAWSDERALEMAY